jgi:SAM-dependent methyltransferase
MRSKELALEQYDTDKMASGYLEQYDEIFDPLVNEPITLLELGVYRGGSLLLWNDYFPSATIVGVDIELPKDFNGTERIHLFEGSQADPAFLWRVSNEIAPNGFDIIIDDASHMGELTKAAFWHLFDNHLKPGGFYVIEDWGTGYRDNWPDGRSLDLEAQQKTSLMNPFVFKVRSKLRLLKPMKCHSYGMVGFVKQLVDEEAAYNVTRNWKQGRSTRKSRFDGIIILPSLVFVRKAGSAQEP